MIRQRVYRDRAEELTREAQEARTTQRIKQRAMGRGCRRIAANIAKLPGSSEP
jgi:hypothetical protein